jgi:hypothetical protein
MIWAWLRKAPKIALVLAIIVGSTLIFGIWWIRHRAESKAAINAPAVIEDDTRKISRIEAAPDHVLFVDNDLYDLDTGERLFRNWLKEGQPRKLFWESDSKTILAQYEKGFIRYAPDGTEKARLVLEYPFGLSNDYKWLLFARNKDIWRADIDWTNLQLTNERQVTNVERFDDAYFGQSILLGSDHILIVRAGMQIVRVNLDNSEVHPTRMPMLDIGKRKSPNGENIVGVQNGQFYCYNLDSDLAKEVSVGRLGINDYQWLGNDKCACIVDGKAVVLYDRIANTLGEVVNLPLRCVRIGAPSPDGRFAFCLGNGKGVLIDFEKKSAIPITGGVGLRWVSPDTFAFSREIADSSLRGIWLQTVGEDERRISLEPYLVHDSGGEIMAVKTAQMIVFATDHGLSTSNFAGTNTKQTVSLVRPPSLVLRFLERVR